jgi:hypothetical protein
MTKRTGNGNDKNKDKRQIQGFFASLRMTTSKVRMTTFKFRMTTLKSQ